MPRPMVIFALLLVPAVLVPLLGAENGLSVEVRARAIAPGEPLRIRVTPSGPLSELGGELLGRSLSFGREDDGAWFAWSLVPLDQEAGPATLVLDGRREDGSPVRSEIVLQIEDRSFPEEHLTGVDSKYVEPPAAVTERLAAERKKLAGIYRSREPRAQPEAAFLRPVPGKPTSVFGTRRTFNGKPRSPHPGLDLRAATGTPVKASGPGLVVLAQDLFYSGNTVIVDHGGGLFTLYAHLSELGVEEGQEIDGGVVVGLSGATGRVTGPHLHWGAKIGNEPFDPRALLDERLYNPSDP